MQVPIKHKTSAEPGKAPAVADLILGELAINTHDGKMFTRKDDGTPAIIELGGGGSLALSASPTAAYTLLASDAGKYIAIEAGGSIVVPSGVFEAGNLVMLFNNTNAIATIDTAAVSAYVEGAAYTSLKLTARGVGYIYFLGPSYCLLFGDFLAPVTLEYFLVAGGGSAPGNQPGGGGAGGLLQGTGLLVDAGVYHTITVGAGGPGGYGSSYGNDTVAFGLTAKGGGRGGDRNSSAGNGGSGGGKGFYNSAPGSGTPGQGYDGGGPTAGNGASGGGGAGGPGVKGAATGTGGSGGPGIYSDFDGTFRWYAGGGAPMSGAGGQGSGSGNYGGGGNASQGAGGPGIAIFKTARVAKLASVDPYVVGGLYVYKFTSSGSILF